MKILFVNDYNVYGGAEYVVQNMLSSLAKEGHEVHLLAKYNSKPTKNFDSILTSTKEILAETRGRTSFNSFDNYVKSIRPDIIHFHNISQFGHKILFRAEKLGIPSIITLHDYWIMSPDRNNPLAISSKLIPRSQSLNRLYSPIARNRALSRMVRLSASKTWIVAVSQYVAKQVARFYNGSKISVISNGVNLAELTNLQKLPHCGLEAKQQTMAMFAGGFSDLKGFGEILKISPLLQKSVPECSVPVTGITANSRFSNKAIPKNILPLGTVSRDKFVNYLSNSLCFLFPSIWHEPFPISILEAMALGKPVVAYSVGGVPEVVENEKTGFLVTQGDYVSFAERIKYLFENQSEALKMGLRAKRKVESEFNISNMCSKYKKLYADLLINA